MVGDRLDTDILFGHQGNLETLLVFSGVTSKQQYFHNSNTIMADFYAESIGHIVDLYENVNNRMSQ
jgi:phosphoglycolate phosphatase